MSTNDTYDLRRNFLRYRAVKIDCLDADKNLTGPASGFLRAEGWDRYFLYTCWHVVTGINPNDPKFTAPPKNRYLRVTMMSSDGNQGLTSSVCEIELYNDDGFPRWLQHSRHKPNADLEAIGIRIPYGYDTIKLQIEPVHASSVISGEESAEFGNQAPILGERVYIVGFPYGYSSFGDDLPVPVVLTRHLAANPIDNRPNEILLDGPGVMGMSGGPVFVERDGKCLLFGQYTGVIYPDHAWGQNQAHSALGTCLNLGLFWRGHLWGQTQPG